jgi:prepilin-type N-terminal cleavage/methylation domain-containing protein
MNKSLNNFIKQTLPQRGFTLPEVLIAAVILIVLAVGTLSVFSYVVRINRGENLRSQALTVMQKEIEHYRSLKYVPVASGLTSAELTACPRTQITFGAPFTSADGQQFDLFVTIDNIPAGTEDATNFKQIMIEAKPTIPERDVWLQNLNTSVTFQRVRSN